MNLLIADDEEIIRQGLLKLKWESIGLTDVYSASNGAEVRDLLLSAPIDIAILDIKMPGASGLELAAMIQKYSLDTAVILLTGFSDFDYARQAMRSGVYEYILKPLRPREILEAVGNVKLRLEQKRYQDQLVRKYEEARVYQFQDAENQIRKHFSEVSPLVANILKDMAAGFAEPLTLEKFAEQQHFSSPHLSRRIKQETGYTFVEILRAIRLTNAAQLIQEGERVSQVCEMTGFRDRRYFSQLFRVAFGSNPSDFKKQEQSPVKFYAVLQSIKEIRTEQENEEE